MAEAESSAAPLPSSVLESARTHARDRYLAALLAPREAREDMLVLAAYLGEVRRVPLLTQDAQIGEIRLQWWRDALADAHGATGHPVADAMAEVARRRGLRGDLVLAPIEGASRELYEDGIRDAREFRLYADETEGAAIRLALAILSPKPLPVAERRAETAGRALASTHVALTLPQHLAHGRLPLPRPLAGDVQDPRDCGPAEARVAASALVGGLADEADAALAQFRAERPALEAGSVAAFLPMALVAPYLAAVRRPGRDVLAEVADISPLSRVVRLWFAHWRGRV